MENNKIYNALFIILFGLLFIDVIYDGNLNHEFHETQNINDKKFIILAEALYVDITEKKFREQNGLDPDPVIEYFSAAIGFVTRSCDRVLKK
jgi:hypothetical protein